MKTAHRRWALRCSLMAVCLGMVALPQSALADPPRPFSLELTGSGRVGASAGHVLVAPYAFVLPGGAGGLKFQWQATNGFLMQSRVAGSVGVDEAGTLGGGYRGRLALGWRYVNEEEVKMHTRFFGGLSSISLIPIPGVGTVTQLTFIPLQWGVLSWTLDLQAELEVLVVVPRLALGAGTGITLDFDWIYFGLDVDGNAEALVAIVANYVSASASANLFLGTRW